MSARVWMNNGKLATCVCKDEMHYLMQQGFNIGRKLKVNETPKVSIDDDVVTWELNPGTELVDPVYYPYYKSKFVSLIYIQDCSIHDEGFCVVQRKIIEFKHIMEYSPKYQSLDEAKTHADVLVRAKTQKVMSGIVDASSISV